MRTSNLLILSLMFLFLLVPFSSAIEFDNVKTFTKNGDKDYGTITIKNLFGYGDKLTEITLLENTNGCLIECKSKLNITTYSNSRLLDEMNFKSANGKSAKVHGYQTYLINTREIVDIIPHYTSMCNYNSKNNSQSCKLVNDFNTTKIRYEKYYVPYNNEVVPAGNYILSLEVQKKINENIDWIAKVQGNDLNEWAWYNQSFIHKKQLNVTGESQNVINFTRYVEIDYVASMDSQYRDIRIANSSETGELAFDFDYKNSTSAGVWIRFPTLFTGTNTIYVYYANQTTVSAANSSANTFAGIRHQFEFNNNLNNLGTTDTMTDGASGSRTYYNASLFKTGTVDSTDNAGLTTSASITLQNGVISIYEVWIQPSTTASFQGLLTGNTGSSGLYVGNAGTLIASADGFNGGATDQNCGSISAGTFYHVVIKVNGTAFQCYLNGVRQTVLASVTAKSDTLNVGYRGDSNLDYVGNMTNYKLLYNSNEQVASDSYIMASYQNGNRSRYVFGAEQTFSNVESTTVSLNAPSTNSVFTNTSTNLDATVTVTGTSNSTNITFFVWNSSNFVYNNTFTTITGNSNQTIINITGLRLGSYRWNAFACAANATFSNCTFAPSNFTFNISNTINSNTFNTSVYETSYETFSTNITLLSNINISAAYLYWNNTEYTATVSGNSPNSRLTASLDIPVNVNSNITWFWKVNYSDGTMQNLTSVYQNVSPINFNLCQPSNNVSYINFTLNDETTGTNVGGFVNPLSLSYYLGSGTTNKSLTYINLTANTNYTFCFTPPNRNLNVNASITYYNATAPQRVVTPSFILSNATRTYPLYLLGTADGQYVTFQVINSADQLLENVFVNATRSLFGNTFIVGSGLTGADGGITFWLNPSILHTFSFLLDPYPLYTTSITPTQSSYTITLGSSASANVSNYNQGINYTIQPNIVSLTNNSLYVFNFSISSSYWTLDNFGFNLTNGSGYLLGTSSNNTASGGRASLGLNVGRNESVIMNYYWIINGSISQGSRSWIVMDFSGNQYSIARLVSDFVSYVSIGFFGLDEFGVGLIAFIIIVGFTGFVRVKYGVADDTALIGLVFGLVVFFDVGLGLLPSPINAVPNFPSIFMGLIFAGFLFKENFQ